MAYPLLTAQHLRQATLVEYDPRGIKVMQQPNGDYLKVFRLRHLYGWARLHGYAQRFCKHARKLESLGIPTVTIKQCYRVEDAKLLRAPGSNGGYGDRQQGMHHTYVVEYAPLAGETLKHLLEHQMLERSLIVKLGGFIAELHAKGIYFRSLHLGNIVLTPQGQLGLIDIADMDIYPWSLWFTTRLRSFRHLTRYAKLNAAFGQENWHLLLESYLNQVRFGLFKTTWLTNKMHHFLLHPPH